MMSVLTASVLFSGSVDDAAALISKYDEDGSASRSWSARCRHLVA
jgi:hypothetical protein